MTNRRGNKSPAVRGGGRGRGRPANVVPTPTVSTSARRAMFPREAAPVLQNINGPVGAVAVVPTVPVPPPVPVSPASLTPTPTTAFPLARRDDTTTTASGILNLTMFNCLNVKISCFNSNRF